MASVTEHWRRYATWLVGRGVTSLGDVDAPAHEDYAVHIAGLPLAQGTRIRALYAVSLLCGFTPLLPAGAAIPMPPWEAEGMAHFLPADAGSNENVTPPIHPAVMSPLLVWALRFVEDFAADILAALTEHQRLKACIAERSSPAVGARLRALLDEHARTRYAAARRVRQGPPRRRGVLSGRRNGGQLCAGQQRAPETHPAVGGRGRAAGHPDQGVSDGLCTKINL